MSSIATEKVPDARGHFGPYGGRFVPETLMHPLQELEQEYFRSLTTDPELRVVVSKPAYDTATGSWTVQKEWSNANNACIVHK